jgi:Tol biopolymer transport system component
MPSTVTKTILAALTIAALWCTPPAQASPARFDGTSTDGSVAFFSTKEQMVNGDTDSREDIFARSFNADIGEYVTRQVSLGPIGGNDAYDSLFKSVSADGSKVLFMTQERLTPDDQDNSLDLYQRNLTDNTTTLVSKGDSSCAAEGCGNGEFAANFAPGGTAAEGTKIFFITAERLSSADHDSSVDVYVRDLTTERTTLVSAGDASCAITECGNAEMNAVFQQVSSDGNEVLFTTEEGLVPSDTDGEWDIYQRDLETETTTLVTAEGTCPSGLNCQPVVGGASSDGSRVFFETNNRDSADDTDDSSDVFEWNGGSPVRVSTGLGGGNGGFNAIYAGSSADGSAVYFETSEQLDAADTDDAQDVYERSGGETSLVSTGPAGGNGPLAAEFRWASPDNSTDAVIFTTSESLVAEDTDESQDVYERSGGTTTLISTGPDGGNGPADAFFAKASHDASRVFFTTTESLVAEDTDSSADVYERSGGQTTLISTGTVGGNGPDGAGLDAVSANGSKAFFSTLERLTSEDNFAEEADVYSHGSGGTLLVSVRNDPSLELGPPAPTLTKTSPGSPGESTEPAVIGQAAGGTTVKLYTNSTCAEAPIATGTSTELASPGIAVAVTPESTTGFWATAEAEGFVSPCSNSSVTYTQEEEVTPPNEEEEKPKEEPKEEKPKEEPKQEKPKETGSKKTKGGSKAGSNGGTTYVTPETRVTFGPSFKTRKRRPVFRFVDATGQPGTTFVCRVDKRRWKSCTSPLKLPRLGTGRHVLRIKGMNAIGVWEPSAGRHRFKVVGR